MSSDLEQEVTVPALMEEAASRRTLHRQTAKNKRPGGKPELPVSGVSIGTNELNGLGLPQFLFGKDELGVRRFGEAANAFEPAW